MTKKQRPWGGLGKRGRIWWLRYTVDGRRVDETTEQGDKRVAERMLADRRREVEAGVWQPKNQRRKSGQTVKQFANEWLARRRLNGIRTVAKDAQRLDQWWFPEIGDLDMREVTRVHVRDLISKMQRTPKQDGTPYSSRSVLHVYETGRVLFGDAIVEGVITTTPCTLKTRRGELPQKRDADPTWRADAVYTRSEAEALIADERIPQDRRVYYALMLLAGMRTGEVSARRWSDYDTTIEPLGRLMVHSQAVEGEIRETKTGDSRMVPVHPALATILAKWKLGGWALFYGRHPRPDDLIVPRRTDATRPRDYKTPHFDLKRDLETLGYRSKGRARHAMRATFMTLLQADGADLWLVRRVTHKAPGDVVSGYLRASWDHLCREVAKLDIKPVAPPAAEVVELARVRDANGSHSPPSTTLSTTSVTDPPHFAGKMVEPRGIEPVGEKHQKVTSPKEERQHTQPSYPNTEVTKVTPKTLEKLRSRSSLPRTVTERHGPVPVATQAELDALSRAVEAVRANGLADTAAVLEALYRRLRGD